VLFSSKIYEVEEEKNLANWFPIPDLI